MSTFIVRLAEVPGPMVGTVERPGEESVAFRDLDELMELLSAWHREALSQDGKASGSISSSPMRPT